MMRHFTYTSTTLLIIAMAFTFWAILTLQPTHTTINPSTISLPDAWMEGIQATMLNKHGKISMVITTPKMTHFTEHDVSVFTNPQLALYQQNHEPWHVSADQATAVGGLETIHFQNNVVIHQASSGKYPATIVKTTALLVHPQNKTAETKEIITMVQPNITVKAQGLYADMNTGNIKLLSTVKGEYVPN